MNCHGARDGRMDGRTQTLKSARAIDAINGCVRLVAGKIDDETQGGSVTLPLCLSLSLFLALAPAPSFSLSLSL